MTLVDMSNGNAMPEPVVLPPMTLASAEISQQIATARAFPRSIQRFRQSALSYATLDTRVAQQCLYAMKRGGKLIEGPSVRLAEILATCWGNNRYGARLVDETENFVIAQGVFMDLESNMAVTVDAQRRIIDSEGRRYGIDMIGVTGAACVSVARRNAVLAGVPKALWWGIYEQAKQTVAGDVRTMAQRRKAAVEEFAKYAVTEAQIFEALGVSGHADIMGEQLATLGGFLTAIKDEGRDPEEVFPPAKSKAQKAPPPPAEPHKGGKQAGGAGRAARAAATEPVEAARGGPGPASSTEESSELTATEKEIAACLGDAETRGDVKALRTMFAVDISGCDAAAKARIEKMFSEAEAKFGG